MSINHSLAQQSFSAVFSHWTSPRGKFPSGLYSLTICFVLGLSAAVALSGCGSAEPEDEAEEAGIARVPGDGLEDEAVVDSEAALTEAQARRASRLPGDLDDLNAWSFLSDEAHVGVVVPTLDWVVDQRLMPLLRRHAPGDWDPDGMNAAWAAYLANGVGLETNDDLGLVQQLEALGVDTQEALAAYFWLDFDEEVGASSEDADNGPQAPADTLDAAAPEGTKWVLALPLREPATAMEQLERFAVEAGAALHAVDTEEGDQILQHPSGQLFYANLGAYMLLGSHTEVIEEALDYARNPLPAFYDTPAMPATGEREAVMLFNMQQYTRDQQRVLDALPEEDPVAIAMQEQQAMLNQIIGGQDAFSPMIATIQWEEEELRLLGRINLEHYPGLLEMTGRPSVHRWMGRLPDDTDSYLSLAFSSEMKGNLLNLILPFVDTGETADMMSPMALTPQLTPLIGDELMLGLVSDNDSHAPYTYLAISMENLDGARLLLQLVLPMTDAGPFRGQEIYQIDLDTAVPFYIAFVDRTILGSNHRDGLETMIAHALDGTTTSSTAPIHAAMPLDAPRYTGLVLKTETLEEFITGLRSADLLEVEMPNPVMEFLMRAVSELHMFNTLDHPFQQLEITMQLR